MIRIFYVIWKFLLGAIHKAGTQVGGGIESWRKRTGAYRGKGGSNLVSTYAYFYATVYFSFFKIFSIKKKKENDLS